MCIQAVEKVVTQYPEHVLEMPVDCILEALRITMWTNTGKPGNMFYTQINGATIGGTESASVTDIFGAKYTDPIAIQVGAKDIKRYRDGTLDVETTGTVRKSKNSLDT